MHSPPWYLANPKLTAMALLCPICRNPLGSGGTDQIERKSVAAWNET